MKGIADVEDRAEQVIRKAKRDGRPLVVLVDGERFRTFRVEDFDALHAKHPTKIVGVYDSKCRPEWLEDDMRAALRNRMPLAA